MRRKNRTLPIKNFMKTLPVLFGVLAVFYTAMLIKDTEVPTVLPVNDIRVEGELNFLDEKEIMETVKKNIADGYLAVDLKRVRETLLQEPWIKDVSLRRRWPADVSIFVEERKPIAYWNDDGYISEAGVVFKPAVIDKGLNLPRLNGPESQHDNVMKFMNVVYKKMAALDYEVRRLDLDDRRAWKLVIASNADDAGKTHENVIQGNEIDVKLGRFDTEKRLQRFIRILPALTSQVDAAEDRIKVIDMRYPNGFAIQKTVADVAISSSSGKDLSINVLPTTTSENDNLTPRNITHDFVYARRYATVQMSEA